MRRLGQCCRGGARPRAEPAARDLPNPGYLNSPLRELVWIALVAVGPVELAASNAPLALVFERLTGASPQTMSLIAIVATLNGIVVKIIMASRVLYGLASYRELPAILSKVDQKTRTPLVATALATAMVLVLALLVALHDLAEITARLTLVVFAAVNCLSVAIKRRATAFPVAGYVAPTWMPWAGAVVCVLLRVLDVLTILHG